MSIRKVSDLPAVENLYRKIQQGEIDSSKTLFEISQPVKNPTDTNGLYLSRSVTFDEIVTAVKSKLSADLIPETSSGRNGTIKIGYPNDDNNLRYGLRVDSDNRGYIQFEYPIEEWTFILSGESGPITLNKKVLAK